MAGAWCPSAALTAFAARADARGGASTASGELGPPGGSRSAPPGRRPRRRLAARWVLLLPALAYMVFAFPIPVARSLVLSFEPASLPAA